MDAQAPVAPVEGTYEMTAAGFGAFTRQLARRQWSRVIMGIFWLVVVGSFAWHIKLSLSGEAEGASYLVMPLRAFADSATAERFWQVAESGGVKEDAA